MSDDYENDDLDDLLDEEAILISDEEVTLRRLWIEMWISLKPEIELGPPPRDFGQPWPG